MPSTLDIEEDFQNETAEFRPKKIFRVVTVLQPPLMDWNQEQGEEKIMIKLTCSWRLSFQRLMRASALTC